MCEALKLGEAFLFLSFFLTIVEKVCSDTMSLSVCDLMPTS